MFENFGPEHWLVVFGWIGTVGVGYGALRNQAHTATKERDGLRRDLGDHVKEDQAVHGDIREMKANIEWIKKTLERKL